MATALWSRCAQRIGRRLTPVLVPWLLLGCGEDVSGPTPAINPPKSGVLPVDPGIVCRAQLTTDVAIYGSGFSPVPIDVPKDPRAALPTVTLLRAQTLDGKQAEALQVVYSGDPDVDTNVDLLSWQRQSKLTFTVNQAVEQANGKVGALAVGLWDVVVKNPNDSQATEAGALAIVDKPTLTELDPSILCLEQGARDLTVSGTTLLEIEGKRPTLSVDGVEKPFPVTQLTTGSCTKVAHDGLDARTCEEGGLTLPSDSIAVGFPSVTLENPETAACTSEETVNLRVAPAPVITGIAPPLACLAQGDRTFVIHGSGFLEIDDEVPAVTVADKKVPVSASECDTLETMGHSVRTCEALEITIAEGSVEPGRPEVVVTNPAPAGCSASSSTVLTIVPPPTVTDVVPPLVCLDGGPRTLEIIGSDFITVDGVVPTVALAGDAVDAAAVTADDCDTLEVDGLDVQSCTRLTVTVPQDFTEEESPDIAVANPDPAGCDDTAAGLLTVVHGPTLTKADPALICTAEGDREVVLTGTNYLTVDGETPTVTVDGQAVTVDGAEECTALAVHGLTVERCRTLAVTIPQGTVTAVHSAVVVENPDPAGCDVTNDEVLTIAPPVTVASATPTNLCVESDAQTVGVTGSGFLRVDDADFAVSVAGSEVGFSDITGCDSLAVLGMDVKACTGFSIEVDPKALGVGDVALLVSNPEPSLCGATTSTALRIVAPPTPTGVTPDNVCSDVATTLTIAGTDLADGATVSLRETTSGTTGEASSVELVDGELRATFDNGIPAGTYDVTVENGAGCDGTLTAALVVDPTPIVFFVDPPVLYSGISIEATIFTSGLRATASSVELVDADGEATPIADFSSPLRPNRILAEVPAGLEAGEYEVRVTSDLGCVGSLPGGVAVTDTLTLALTAVDPGHVSLSKPTAVTISATNPTPDGQAAFVQTPRVYLNPTSGTGVATALKAVTFQGDTTLSAVVPQSNDGGTSSLPEGSYDLIVVNPTGEVGVLDGAIIVPTSEPPIIASVTPSTVISGDVAATVTGQNFDTAGVRVNLTCRTNGGTPETVQATVSGTVTATSIPVFLPVSGFSTGTVCLVQVINTGGTGATGPSFTYSAISVRSPSANLPNWTTADDTQNQTQQMVEGRRALALTAARPTFTSRYLYAIGGDEGTPASAKTSVEAVNVGVYGELGAWRLEQGSLPSPRTQAGAETIDRFVYLVGGHDGDAASSTLLRAQVLDPLAAPEILDLDALLGDETTGLGAGHWAYRVSAVFPNTDANNPDGQSLPSEALNVDLPDLTNRIVLTITWQEVAGAERYFVYRSPTADAAVDEVEFLGEVTCGGATPCSYTDEGAPTETGVFPLPPGSLGAWHTISGVGLTTPREGLAAAAVQNPAASNEWYLYAFGGRDENGDALDGYEWAKITVESDGSQTVDDFVDGTSTIGTAKADLVAWVVTESDTSLVGAGNTYVYVGTGTEDGGGFTDEVYAGSLSTSNTDGDLGTLTAQNGPQRRGACGAGAAAGYLYLFGGEGNGGIVAQDTATQIAAGPVLENWNAPGGGALQARRSYLGSTQESAFFFVAGGTTDTEDATRSVEYVVR